MLIVVAIGGLNHASYAAANIWGADYQHFLYAQNSKCSCGL